MKRFCLIALSLLLLVSLFSCGKSDDAPAGETPDTVSYRVMLSVAEGAKVLGDSSVDVKEGDTVEFQV